MKKITIREIPIIIQNGAMLNPAKGMRLDEEVSAIRKARLSKPV